MKEIKLYLFGGFRLTIGQEEYQLERWLGKKLSALFALIILGDNYMVNKEYLIEKLWQDSDNPVSALKYSIFRLRASLKKIPGLEEIELVQTLKNGYSINQEEVNYIDVHEFAELYAKRLEDNQACLKMYELYGGHLCATFDGEWIDSIREHYFRQYLYACEKLCQQAFDCGNVKCCIEVAEKVLTFDEYNELFNIFYLKGLIQNSQYNTALKHYDSLSKKFLETFGYTLKDEENEIFKIISKNSASDARKSIHELVGDLSADGTELGAFYSDYFAFKKMYQYELRNSLRTRVSSYFVLFEIRCTKDKMEQVMKTFLEVISKTLRINDVYTQVNAYQVGLILKLRNQEDAYIVIERLMNKLYTKYNSKQVKLNYYVADILHEAENIVQLQRGEDIDPKAI